MAFIEIQTFQLWYKVPQHIGQVKITLQTGNEIPLRNLSPPQFAAIGKILDNAPVYYDPETGWFATSDEVPQD